MSLQAFGLAALTVTGHVQIRHIGVLALVIDWLKVGGCHLPRSPLG